ncbi:hypothetical protein JT26_03525 [Porphyromonas sp. COT-108 OH1349]|nr:hypothetical protein JT26_03525 [Porphyromonas sp. COT-108 OH1349]
MKKTAMYGLLLFNILFLASCGGKKAEDSNRNENETRKVSVGEVLPDTVRVTEAFTANLEAYVTNKIAPQIPNRISKILVEVGQNVSQGQLLVTLDEANMTQQRLQLENMEADFKRIDELYAVGGISKAQWEAKKTALSVTRTAFKNLSQNTMLTSPVTGVVTQRNYDNGDMFAQIPILVIEQISPLKMRINVSEKHFSDIRKGIKVSLETDVYPGEEFGGVVALTYPTIDPKSRTFETEIEIKNANRKLRPGMYAKATLDFGTKPVLLVSDKAVNTLAGTNKKYVFVVENGTAIQRNVRLGNLYGNQYEVLEGLQNGDKVVTAGATNLKDGDKVEY